MDAFEQVHHLIRQGLEQGAYPCAALAVGIGPTLYLKRTYGSCTENTLFDMASVSKILSPTMIAFRFLEDGMLRLYDCVGDFFPDAPADKREITIAQLMTHTSGIADHFFLSDDTSDPADAARVILAHPLAQPAGGDPIYTCWARSWSRSAAHPWISWLKNMYSAPSACGTPAIIPQAISHPRSWIPLPASCSRVSSTTKTPVSSGAFPRMPVYSVT